MTIAQTILSQLGGNKFCALTGAKNFSFDSKDQCGALIFAIGRNSKGVNRVAVTLTADDLYDITFYSLRSLKLTKKAEVTGIYADMLCKSFEEHTGLYTSF
jgi:hypothetical protein